MTTGVHLTVAGGGEAAHKSGKTYGSEREPPPGQGEPQESQPQEPD